MTGRSRTLGALLAARAETDGARTAFWFYPPTGDREPMTYADLHGRAVRLAARLRRCGVVGGDRVLVTTPAGLDFVAAFFGCLYAGAIAVPAFPPRGSRHDERLVAILRDAEPAIGLTTLAARARRGDPPAPPGMRWLAADAADADTDADTDADDEYAEQTAAAGHDVAFLQYTSGSTGQPKGVVVSHRAALANLELIARNFALGADDVGLSWLPPYHDMGLIGGILTPIYAGIPCALLPPGRFAREPGSWLRTLTAAGATVSGGPDFAYRLCADRIPDAECADVDLSRWRIAFTGAETVRASTIRDFVDRFTRYGFDAAAVHPCYGLAEATLIVAGKAPGTSPRLRPGDPDLVSCGGPLTPLRVVDPQTALGCADGQVGEVWVGGDSVAGGYWAGPTGDPFGARLAGEGRTYLRTGDLGFLEGGELFVTGRLKELLIVRGRNLYPSDVEDAATGAHPLVAGEAAAAFGLPADPARPETERFGVLVEVDRHSDSADRGQALIAARAAIVARCGVAPDLVALVRRASLPRTSSGKIRRGDAGQHWHAGTLPALAMTRAGERPTGLVPIEPPPDDPRARIDWLRRLVAAVLGLDAEAIAAQAPLVGLGLDSLTGAQLVAVARRHGVAVPLQAILDGASLADLVAASGPPGAQAAPDRDPLRPSPGQHALWRYEQVTPGTPAYTMAAAVRLRSDVDVERLDAALRAVLVRHPGLRSRFEGAQPQVHIDPVPARLLTVEEPAAPAELPARLTQLCGAAFDLSAGALVRAGLVPVTGEDPVLLLAAHHAVVDLWSFDVLLADLDAAYAGDDLGPPEPMVPAPPGPAEVDREWWRERLGGDRARLPADRPAPPRPSHHGRLRHHHLAVDTGRLAREGSASPFAVLLAGVAILVARLGGGDDVVIGVPVAVGRGPAPGAVAYLVNVVPVRIQLGGARSTAEVLRLARAALAGAVAHADVPFAELVALAARDHRGERDGLVDILLVDETANPAGRAPAGLIRKRLPVDRGGAAFDLSILVSRGPAGWESAWEYATDRFDDESVARLARRLDTLLAGMSAEPGRDWRRLELLDPAERRLLRRFRRGLAAAPLPGGTVPARIAHHAVTGPDRPALVELCGGGTTWTEGHSLSYRELVASASAVGTLLCGRGVVDGDRVGLRLGRSIELIVAMLGTWAAGAAYVPVDPGHPRRRNDAILADAGVAVTLTEADVTPALVVGDATADPGRRAGPPLPARRAEDVAYLIYTSGSTGSPKGVLVDHGNLAASTAARFAFYPGAVDRFLLLSSPAFDSSVAGIYWTLCAGGTVALPPAGIEADPVAALAALRASAASHTLTLPSLYAEIGQAARAIGPAPRLRTVVVAGEECRADLIASHAVVAPQAILVNEYGPTEATVWATAHTVDPQARGASVPIGRPVAGMTADVLDARGAPAGIGVPGELYLGGPQVARDLHPDPASVRFVSSAGTRRYRTGDLVSWSTDGALRFHGRLDQQVKVRGHRVEPAEVEAVIATHPDVAGCVVVAWPSPTGIRLVAYVVVAPARTLPPADLVAWLTDRLPAPARPAAVVPIERIPRAPTGKVDRRALPPPPLDRPGPDHRPPVGEWEDAVAAAFAEVLGTPAVSRDDDFFTLGGESLAAAQVAARLTSRLQTAVQVRDVLTEPIVHRLGALLAGRSAGSAAPAALPPIRRQPRQAVATAERLR